MMLSPANAPAVIDLRRSTQEGMWHYALLPPRDAHYYTGVKTDRQIDKYGQEEK